MESESDEAVAKKVQGGDRESFAILIRRYELKLTRYARRFLSDANDITDYVQDVFIKAYENLNSFDPSRRFSPWVYRIAHNEFVNALRKRSGKLFISLDSFDTDVLFPHPHSSERADENTLRREASKETETLLRDLPDKYREIVILSYFEELSYDEIAEVLRIPVSTVGVRLLRARLILREAYKKKYGTYE